MNKPISESDLILNPDGSVYHLNLLPEDLAGTVITVGDPDRVASVSKYFDRIDIRKGKREFITHTGFIGNKRVSVISTGIGTDNIDIVLNELDALVNIDLESRQPKPVLQSMDIIRIGTSGSIQADIPMGTILASGYGLGLDALMRFYESGPELPLLTAVKSHFDAVPHLQPYLFPADPGLLQQIGAGLATGITVTAPGFYAPQGRAVRARRTIPKLIPLLSSFNHHGHRISNLEMETAGIYALAAVLGHRALSVNAILASRLSFAFEKEPQRVVDGAIQHVLERL
ncbi:phosphorylase [Pedobacter yulinensis]|uniref:Uridine phosphorylase n=1 Tax=Pedobacter yulinensis TaxID=2126353 RepID=A0A2T3HKQ3_9SPHI|nr:nucleoside phosphorylase [Pedobacter yulinensis]PST83038.1 phosphorylase [Pedobacter yulinensis]